MTALREPRTNTAQLPGLSLGWRGSRRDALRLAALGMLTLATGSLTACAEGQAAIPTSTLSTTSGPFVLQIGFGGDIFGDKVVTLADKLDYLKQKQITLERHDFTSSTAAIEWIVTGGGHIASVSLLDTLAALHKGVAVKVIGGQTTAPDVAFLVAKDSPLQQIDDVRGKRIGCGDLKSVIPYWALKGISSVGLGSRSAKLLKSGSENETWQAVQDGKLDIAFSTQPNTARLVKNGEARVLWSSYQIVPSLVDRCLITSRNFIPFQPGVIRSFLAAQAKAVLFLQRELDKAAELLATDTTDASIIKAALIGYPKSSFTITLPADALEATGKQALDLKIEDLSPAWNLLIDENFLPADYRGPLPVSTQ